MCLLQLRDRRVEIGGAFANSLFQSRALIIQEKVRVPAGEEIANSQNNFSVIKWLAQEIGCAGFERPSFCFFTRVRGKNNYREKVFVVFGTERFQNGKAIGAAASSNRA